MEVNLHSLEVYTYDGIHSSVPRVGEMSVSSLVSGYIRTSASIFFYLVLDNTPRLA